MCSKNFLLFIGLILISGYQGACVVKTVVTDDCDKPLGYATAKFLFINQITDTIKFIALSGPPKTSFRMSLIEIKDSAVIFPGDTGIFHDQRNCNEVDINKYYPSQAREFAIVYGQSNKCDYTRNKHNGTFDNIQSYEIRKEISENNFEFTYFFTEAKKANMGKCW